MMARKSTGRPEKGSRSKAGAASKRKSTAHKGESQRIAKGKAASRPARKSAEQRRQEAWGKLMKGQNGPAEKRPQASKSVTRGMEESLGAGQAVVEAAERPRRVSQGLEMGGPAEEPTGPRLEALVIAPMEFAGSWMKMAMAWGRWSSSAWLPWSGMM